ncbi:MAG: DUF2889 domain-containing protein [Desulfobacterales bacterium]
MNLLKEIDQKAKLQSRSIEITSYEGDDAHIIVCGELRDRRLVQTYTLEGTPREAAAVHHMRICMKVAVRTLTITEIDAELPRTPHEECADMHRTLAEIRGFTLSRGFSSRVRKKIGGRSGCIHLTTLLLAMAPAALQGYWVHNDRNPQRRRISGEHLEHYLIDTCRVWRREGPLVEKIATAAGLCVKEGKGRCGEKIVKE